MSSNNKSSTLGDVREDLRELRHDVASCVTGASHSGMDAIRHSAEVVQDSTRHAIERASQAKDRVHETAAEHPLATALIAFGVGALAMRILTHRRA